jgi:CopA family copper-resistance protein
MKQVYFAWVLFCLSRPAFSQQLPDNDTTLELQTSEASEQRPLPEHKGKMVAYHLYVRDSTVNFAGKKRRAIAINGQIPAPTLYFTEGDTARIYVHNLKKEEVSIHWHGILLPNRDDGVPYLTTSPIKGGGTHLFEFPIRQTGTFWYHSHTGLQLQSGLYGPLVFYKADEKKQPEEVLQISDWTDIRPKEVHRLLKRNSDYFDIKKDAVQSYGEALVKGHLRDKIKFEWMRMSGADLTDVFYSRYLMQGLPKRSFPLYKKGDSIRLRIINGSSATYFWLQFAGGKMKVLSADGNDVKPVEVDKLLVATAETYDILIKIPDDGQYEFRATAQDIKGYASAFFGTGPIVKVPDMPPMNYFKLMSETNKMMSQMREMGMKMTMGLKMENKNMSKPKMNELKGAEKPTNMNHMRMAPKMETMDEKDMPGMGKDMSMHDTMPMKMRMMKQMMMMKKMKLTGIDVPTGNGDDKVLSYDMLRQDTSTALPPDRPWREIHLTLSGSMQRYVWSINGKTFSQLDEKVMIHKGENVRVYFTNATMMEHPMHLHGHFFRVLNVQGEYAPMKHTFNINPMGMTIIEFAATEQKDWFLHCHTEYHMMSGMATVVSYEGTQSDIQKKYATGYKKFKKEHGGQTFFWGSAQIHSQRSFVNMNLSGLNWQLRERGAVSWKGDYESETYLDRFLDKRKFWRAYIETDNRYTRADKDKNGMILKAAERTNLAAAGMSYLLPLFIMADGRVDHKGNFRFQISRQDFQLTKRIRLDALWNTDKEYEIGAHYILGRYFALSANYDSDYKWGAGITIMY